MSGARLLGRRAMMLGTSSVALSTASCLNMTPPLTRDSMCSYGLKPTLIGGRQEICRPPENTPVDLAWHLRKMKVPDAWRLPNAVARRGAGILIGHIDTGVAEHEAFRVGRSFDNGPILWSRGYDFIDDIEKGYDPLIDHAEYLEQVGHGTSTASVIVGGGDVEDWTGNASCGGTTGEGRITGVAPEAKLIPARAFRFAATSRLDRVAEAIEFLHRERGVHVITMALGWPFPDDRVIRAIEAAVLNNVLVLVAAGNFISSVTFPANIPEAIAVGGVDYDDEAWCGGSQGRRVAISAYADKVWRAYRDNRSHRLDLVGPRYGTSFAVSLVAGVGALWLAHFGRDRLIARAGIQPLQELFRHELQTTARKPNGWAKHGGRLGDGIVDAQKLLARPLL
jgi:serine protease